MSKPKAKEVEKKVKKVVEDKTFGLKNKNKSKKVQQYIKHVSVNAVDARARKELDDAKARKEAEKMAKEMADAEMNALFKAAQAVPVGVDKKSLICQFFKMGTCKKGKACKFSHNVEVQRKTEKIDIHVDPRAAQAQADADNMENWDQAKLEEVVNQAEKKRGLPPTDIICKYFLDALESRKYGFFWKCPNGGDACHYQHCLPPGFVLKEKKTDPFERDDEDDGPTLEETIEMERAILLKRNDLTPVTDETFRAWKERKAIERAAKVEEKRQEEIKKKGGKGLHVLSGRDLFVYDPTLFVDDDDAVDADDYEVKEEQLEDEAPVERVYGDDEPHGQSMAGGSMDDLEIDESVFLDDAALPEDDEDEEDEGEGEADNV